MRLIDADELNFEKLQDTNGKAVPANEYIAFLKGAIAAEELIKNAPTVDVEPVVHAHWIEESKTDKFITHCCSNCGGILSTYINAPLGTFCYKCGAKMDEEQ